MEQQRLKDEKIKMIRNKKIEEEQRVKDEKEKIIRNNEIEEEQRGKIIRKDYKNNKSFVLKSLLNVMSSSSFIKECF